jgi:capsular polysaccharide biosynthesis protein
MDIILNVIQATVWYLGIGLLLSCVIILIDEQVRTRIKERRDEKDTDNH